MSRLVRIWLLVLLTALLPVRGALAAAMLCAPASASHSQHQAHDGARHEHTQTSGEHQQSHHDGSDRCSLCASCCTAVPLMGVLPRVPEPLAAPQRFPTLHAPAPSFVSDGWERPPRSI